MNPLDGAVLDRLAEAAKGAGIVALGAVGLDDPGFEAARVELDRHLDRGFHGEMAFMERTRGVRKHPEGMLEGARTVLVGVVPYRGEPGPVARYAQFHDYHTIVHRRLESVVAALRDWDPDVETLICVDTKPLMERTAAALAGLGFLGKNGCLIVPGVGSYVLIGAVLTTAPLSADAEPPPRDPARVRWDACGQCTACMDACPTAAFDSPGRLDPRRCISYLTIEHRGPIGSELAEHFGERVAGCDVCQEVCPHNHGEARLGRLSSEQWLPDPPGGPKHRDVLELVSIRSGRYNSFVRHTPLGRIPRRHLRRNAVIALGNRPDPLTEEERLALEAALQDAEPLVRDAARWALARRQEGAGVEVPAADVR